MSQSHPTSSQPDPILLDIGELLNTYLQQLVPLFADRLAVSVCQARQAFCLSIDGVVFSLVHHQTLPKPYGNTDAILSKSLHIASLDSINALAVAHDFFGKLESPLADEIHLTTQLSHQQALTLMGMVAALGVHLLDRIRLGDQESEGLKDSDYRLWLDLQTVFFSPKLKQKASKLAIRTPPPLPTHSDYHHKLGKMSSRFDNSRVTIPSFGWLIALSQRLQRYRIGLALGKQAVPPPPTKSAFKSSKTVHTNILRRLFAKFNKAWVISFALITVIALISLLWYASQDKTPEPTSAPSSEPIPQDVAIIRIDETSEQDNSASHSATGGDIQDATTSNDRSGD